MDINIFKILAKRYFERLIKNQITVDELIRLLCFFEKNMRMKLMFRFGSDSTVLYSIKDIETDLINSTKSNKDLLLELIKFGVEENQIEVM